MDSAAAIGMLVGLVIGLAIGAVIGGIMLRAGVWLYNKLAGGPDSPRAVPEPPLGKAMGIAVLTGIVNAIAGFVIGLAIGAFARSSGVDTSGAVGPAQLVALPVGIVITISMLSAMLPTTVGRAFLVMLCQLLILIPVGICIGAIVFVGALAFRHY